MWNINQGVLMISHKANKSLNGESWEKTGTQCHPGQRTYMQHCIQTNCKLGLLQDNIKPSQT